MASRRAFLFAAAGLSLSHVFAADESTAWKAGKHYVLVNPRIPTGSAKGRVEVLEFFWYGCPHCYTLEPHLVLWNHAKPGEVDFRRVPVAWNAEQVTHARLYHALRLLRRDDLHESIFDSFHRLRKGLRTVEEQAEFLAQHGIDRAKYKHVFQSKEVDSEVQRAERLWRGYSITGVPALAINGKYTTDVYRAGGDTELMNLVNHLIARET